MLVAAEQFLEQQMHPTIIISQYRQALEDMITLLEGPLSIPVDKNDKESVAKVVSGILSFRIKVANKFVCLINQFSFHFLD